MDNNSGEKINELGVCIDDLIVHKPKTKIKCYNSKLKIFREFALATLSVLAETKSKQVYRDTTKEPLSQVYALDALACTGIAGIQWKKRLPSLVHVTVAELDDTKKIMDNAQANSLSCTEHKLNPLRVPGDFLDQQGAEGIHVCQAEAKLVMMMEAFNFIYLSPTRNCASYFEPALHGVTSEGILCIVIPDISLFARSPHVVQRFYAADIVKTEYLKELAARIVLASLARAAARYVKGISPQYVLSHDDYLLICVKISRGHSVADSSINEIEKLLHCRLCEERTFLPNQLAPCDDPYGLLACSCKKNNPGKTAVVLGPIWKGHLYEPDFLNHLHRHGKQLSLSARFFELVNLLIKESLCTKTESTKTVVPISEPEMQATEKSSTDCIGVNTQIIATSSSTAEECTISAGDTDEKMITPESIVQTHEEINETKETTNGRTLTEEDQIETSTPMQKRKAEDGQENGGDETKPKRQRKDKGGDTTNSVNVPFYYNITKFKKTNLPKLDKLVTILQCFGHRASRTHFDSCAIRTSASVKEFLHILG